MNKIEKKNPSSFRDPSGYIFYKNNILYRAVNHNFKEVFDKFINSDLYSKLVEENLIIRHTEIDMQLDDKEIYKVIQPELINLISYPYEWSFLQLKDAALLTLKIQRLALQHGFVLRDASAFNIQFYKGKPILIDTLSLGIYQDGSLWDAYGQFCRHFLAPLALMSLTDIRLASLSHYYLDGIPLDLTVKLLPFLSWRYLSLILHLHLHNWLGRPSYEVDKSKTKKLLNKESLNNLITSLEKAIKVLPSPLQKSVWSDYYSFTNYKKEAFISKQKIVLDLLSEINPMPCTAWDIGGNDGIFAKLLSIQGIQVTVFDNDHPSIDRLYKEITKQKLSNIFPLIMDLRNPSSALGWMHKERLSWLERGPVDLILALALIHHLRIGNNLPFNNIAEFFSEITRWLIVEYIPKDDSQVQRLLKNRNDIFIDFTQDIFEKAFSEKFKIHKRINIPQSGRVLYLMEKYV
jgi:hypothetical protein